MRFTCTTKDHRTDARMYAITCNGHRTLCLKDEGKMVGDRIETVDIEPGDIINEYTILTINREEAKAVVNVNGRIKTLVAGWAAAYMVHKRLCEQNGIFTHAQDNK